MKKLLIISAWLATLCASMGQAVVNRDRLSLLRDVSLGSLTTGRPLVYDGSKWVNTTLGWSALSGTPTTLAGYGITDAAALSHTHTFASLTSKPTTLAGYGITDALAASGDGSALTNLTAGHIATGGTLSGVTITSAPNVGIGVSASANPLEIEGASYAYAEIKTTTTGEASAGFRARNNLNHEVLLDVYGSGSTDTYVGQSLASMGRFVVSPGISSFVLNTEGAAPIIFGSNSSEVMRITSAGVKTTRLNISSIPTSASGLVSGDVWSNGGVLTIIP